jgi:pimeloyl-ACP methyl ester carboxylesterase
MPSVKINDSTIYYLDQGEGHPIVLLHGFCGSSHYWDEVIPPLSESYRVIAPDLPGHGHSEVIEKEASIDDIADMIKFLLDELNLQQVTMFGHSLGGYVTLSFAEKYSDRLKGFSLVHSTAFPDSEEAKKGRVNSVEKVKSEGIRPLIDGLVPKLFSPDNLESNAEEINAAKQIGYATSPQGAIHTLLAMKDRPDRNRVLQNTELLVLLIAGEKDQIIPAEKTFSVSKENIMQVLIKGSGHMSMYENPGDLVREIKNFLEG